MIICFVVFIVELIRSNTHLKQVWSYEKENVENYLVDNVLFGSMEENVVENVLHRFLFVNVATIFDIHIIKCLSE